MRILVLFSQQISNRASENGADGKRFAQIVAAAPSYDLVLHIRGHRQPSGKARREPHEGIEKVRVVDVWGAGSFDQLGQHVLDQVEAAITRFTPNHVHSKARTQTIML